MRSLMGQVANDGHPSFKKGLPFFYALRSFCSRNRLLAMPHTEIIVLKRISAPNTEHLKTLVAIIQNVRYFYYFRKFTHPWKVWHLDETAICASYGPRYRGFNAPKYINGGLRMRMKDSGNHLTSVIMRPVAGHISAMFVIAHEKSPVRNWKNHNPPQITAERPHE